MYYYQGAALPRVCRLVSVHFQRSEAIPLNRNARGLDMSFSG